MGLAEKSLGRTLSVAFKTKVLVSVSSNDLSAMYQSIAQTPASR